ncbi:hypothetical protein GCM10027020_10870 [Nocardioides salsibiostraticola]
MDHDEAFAALVEGFTAALGDNAVGLYVLASESAFLGVTRSRVERAGEDSLRGLHRTIASETLEGSYAPVADLRSPMSLGRSWLRVSPGSRELMSSPHDNTAHRRWQFRDEATTLLGPPPRDVLHEVDGRVLRAEAVGLVRFRAEEIEEHPELLRDPAFRVELVLDLSFVLHTAVRGAVLRGSAAAHWARDEVLDRERVVVDAVLAGSSPEAPATRSFAWEVHRLAGAAALRLREH